MLKLTYTDNNFYVEYLRESLEVWLTKRVLLCLRAATSIYVEPSTASFVIPANLSYQTNLKTLQVESGETIKLNACDAEYLEVSLKGTWMTSEENSDEGIFVCALGETAEMMLNQIWQDAQKSASAI